MGNKCEVIRYVFVLCVVLLCFFVVFLRVNLRIVLIGVLEDIMYVYLLFLYVKMVIKYVKIFLM